MPTTSLSSSVRTKKALAIGSAVLCGALLFFLISPTTFAAMISTTDNPSNVSEATGGEGSARTIARTLINFFLFFLGIVATIMIIYGGFLYVTARGEEEHAKKGMKILQYAIIGIIIILVSFAVVNTILGAASGTEPTA